MQQTFCTKLVKNIIYGPTDILTSYLNEYSELFQKIEHKLYVDTVHKKTSITKLKKDYQVKYGINARQFNSVRVSLESKTKAKKELLELELSDKQDRLINLDSTLKKLEEEKITVFEKLSSLKMNDKRFKATQVKYKKIKNRIHYTKRKINAISDKLRKLENDLEQNIVRICFGGKELFQKQFNLKENGYKNHFEWLSDWKNARSNQCFFLGSSDETYGNQICQYDKNNLLKIKTAPVLEKQYGKYVEIPNVYFKYGQDKLDYCKESFKGATKTGNTKTYFNSAMSHRFCRKEHGWYLHTSVDIDDAAIVTDSNIGGIGVDFNVNFVAITFVDRFGNPLKELNLKFHMYAKSSNQIDAKLGDLSKEICDLSLVNKVPIYIEDLCFAKAKKYTDKGKKYNRMINSFPYSKFETMLKQRALKEGIQVAKINPSYTSIVGQFKFMRKYGLSSHGAAACMIARKGMGFGFPALGKERKKALSKLKPELNMNIDNYKAWASLSSEVKQNFTFVDRIQSLYNNLI